MLQGKQEKQKQETENKLPSIFRNGYDKRLAASNN